MAGAVCALCLGRKKRSLGSLHCLPSVSRSRLSLMAVGTHRQVTCSDFIRNSSFLPACSFVGSQQRVCTQDLSFLIIALCNLFPGNKSMFVRKLWIMGRYAEMKMGYFHWPGLQMIMSTSGLWEDDLPVPGVILYPKQHSAVLRWWTRASPERNQPLCLWLFQGLVSAQGSW